MSVAGAAGSDALVHGLGHELVRPDWAPIVDEEVAALIARYPLPRAAATPRVVWRSPRPMSAAALVDHGGEALFVKRHDPRVRSAEQLTLEHELARRLREGGIPLPRVLVDGSGETALACDGAVYELHERAPGVDAYRDAASWTPFRTLAHARSAGAALARLHVAAARVTLAPRPPAVLTSSCAVLSAPDPLASVGSLARSRPGLARFLEGRSWEKDMARYHLPAIRRAAPLLARLPPRWGHGDWHPSNLTWTTADDDAAVAGVLDLGCANRTRAAHDLAVALERSVVSWLDLEGTRRAGADLDAAHALLDGYESVRRLTRDELSATVEVLPVVHLEYALSEGEYFAEVLGSPERAELTYTTYLVGHTAWFAGSEGSELLDSLRRRATGR
ncbi:MAG: phosphotransferase [Actinomycetota bacterium]|nr:phosphotransferase [Actinomycetota bacterium]